MCMEKSVFVCERSFAQFMPRKGSDEGLVANRWMWRVHGRSVCHILDIDPKGALNPRAEVWKDQSAERVSLTLQGNLP